MTSSTPTPSASAHLALWLATFAILFAPVPASAQTFVDVTAAAGIGGVQTQMPFSQDCIEREVVCVAPFSGGVTVGDFNADGRPDLFVTRFGAADALYENQGDGTFVDVASMVGVAGGTGTGEGAEGYTNGALFADIDNDGDQDLLVTVIGDGGPRLYINDGLSHADLGGRPRFTEEALLRGLDVAPDGGFFAGFSVAAGDYDRDGWPDLFVTAWQGWLDDCEHSHMRLFRGVGAAQPGHFVDVTRSAGAQTTDRVNARAWGFSAAFVDLDADGLQDLALTSDFGTSRLLWNRGDGAFEDGTAAAGIDSLGTGMGSSIADYDQDGDLDWFGSAISAAPDVSPNLAVFDGNRLFQNDGDRAFVDVSVEMGVRAAAWGWGSAFFDPDHDRDLDLIVTNGYQLLGAEHDRTRYFRRDAEVFTEQAAAVGLDDDGLGKGLVLLDYDSDGDQDVFIARNSQLPLLLRNDGGASMGDWLRVRAAGTVGTRDAYGARVTIRRSDGASPQYGTTDTISHFLGRSERVAHFGLGAGVADAGHTFEVTVRFLSGHTVVLPAATPNQEIVVVEPVAPAPLPPAMGPPPPCDVRDQCAIDCDRNGRQDVCDVLDPTKDCNDNQVVDSCEWLQDCDFNGVADICTLSIDPNSDLDGDGYLDVCEPGQVDAGGPSADGGAGSMDGGMDAGSVPGDAGVVHDVGSLGDVGVDDVPDAALAPPTPEAPILRGGAACAAAPPWGSSRPGWMWVAWLLFAMLAFARGRAAGSAPAVLRRGPASRPVNPRRGDGV